MTAHDAAVRAVAGALRADEHEPETIAAGVLAALATNADVRAGLVDALTEAAVSHPHGDLVMPAVWRATAEWNIDAVLAALGGGS